MDASDKPNSDLLGVIKSWFPKQTEPAHVSRDFWMPDHSCLVCYECDSQFSLFNRRHHCRLCGRVFCAKCTSHFIPVTSSDQSTTVEERIRVCNFCFKQWEQGLTAGNDQAIRLSCLDITVSSPSERSFTSTRSSGTVNSSSTAFASGSRSELIPHQSAAMEVSVDLQDVTKALNNDCVEDLMYCDQSTDQFPYCMNSDDDEDFGGYASDTQSRQYSQINGCYEHLPFDDMESDYGSGKVHPDIDMHSKSLSATSLHNSYDLHASEEVHKIMDEVVPDIEEGEPQCIAESVDSEPVDFENSGVLWHPPDPEDAEDDIEATPIDDDDDVTGEWRQHLHTSSSFGSGEFRSRDRSNEEHKNAIKNVVDGHFRALVAQLLQVEDLPVGEEGDEESWLEIITSLSWEGATLLKPDTSKCGGMDPGGYVKIKCLASGRRRDSTVVKGVVCKKNVAHRRMISNLEKPRILILGGALEYQRVSNLLSSFDTLLQQEMDHLKMAVAKIDAHHPNILLVEKSVSRYAQEYLLAKGISLVLNIKRPLLERIARCTGGQIVPSIDHLSSQKLGCCDHFYVKRSLEEHGTAGHDGKKLVKTLMYFEGCPKPLGCTVLLRGANGDELKKVKHVVQYGIFAAYHLALETSFLADEGASLPQLPLDNPLTVAIPDKSSSVGRSISTIPGFKIPINESAQTVGQPTRSLSDASALMTRSTGDPTSYVNPSVSSSGHYVPYSHSDEPSPFGLGEVNHTYSHLGHSDAHVNKEVFSAAGNDFSEVDARRAYTDLSSAQVDGKQVFEEPSSLKEEFAGPPSDHQSILVSLSSRCVWKGTVCERSHLFRIKYYSNFDKPLGRYLCDHLFDQGYRCRFCEMSSEAHVQCYTHRQGTLTISVKKLPSFLLPGEKDRKIWMWHRCLRCPRINGYPPATRRIVMSDAAWGLSFGKFLELSFSNHAAASRVASCGHSLHRDCLRFYGFGKMVACFRYASIDVHSVYLPPSKLDFNYENQDWVQNELNQVVGKAALMFSDVVNSLRTLAEKRSGIELPNSMKIPKARCQIADLESMLQKEKDDFEKLVENIKNKEIEKGQPALDILEINQLLRQIFVQSYGWDGRLKYEADTIDNNTSEDYNPVMLHYFEAQGGPRYMFPVGVNDSVVPVYDDEPSSIISYALLSPDYLVQLSDETERSKDAQHIDPENLQFSQSDDESVLKSYRSFVGDESSEVFYPHFDNKTLHARVLFDQPLCKAKYDVTCYYAKRFEALRKICCPSEMDFVRSLSRCKKGGTQGAKRNVLFTKTLDERFIIKQVTKTELESFLKFAPEYFKYLSESILSGRKTCLAKILGIYQVTTKNVEGGKELNMDLLVMENIHYGRNLTRLYDLKGSSRSRYNPDSSGSDKVLLDQNFIEEMPTSPILVGSKAKRLLERAVWGDTAFLASVDVMDYSLLVGIDGEKHELVLGIINYMRPYTWDKKLETWVKSSGIFGGPKNASPTVIPPDQYKKRFRKAMATYFLMVPDEWSPHTIIDLAAENAQDSYADEHSPGGAAESLVDANVSDVATSSLPDKVYSLYWLVVNRILHCIYG